MPRAYVIFSSMAAWAVKDELTGKTCMHQEIISDGYIELTIPLCPIAYILA